MNVDRDAFGINVIYFNMKEYKYRCFLLSFPQSKMNLANERLAAEDGLEIHFYG